MGEARSIYVGACAEIAAALSPMGFRYRASRHSMVAQDGDLRHEISFQSSLRNFLVPQKDVGLIRRAASWLPGADLVTFGSVTLIVHAGVYSKTIKLWRASMDRPLSTGDYVTGGQIGNLQSKPQWIEFNLANPHHRDGVIRDVVSLIRGAALPYFARFSNPEQVIEGLLNGTMPWFWEPSALEYACCFGSIQQARSLVMRYLQMRPEQIGEYHQLVDEYRKTGLPEAFDSRAPGRLAKAALALGLTS